MVTTAMMMPLFLRAWAHAARPWASAVIAQDLHSRLFSHDRSVWGLVPGCRPPWSIPRTRCGNSRGPLAGEP